MIQFQTVAIWVTTLCVMIKIADSLIFEQQRPLLGGRPFKQKTRQQIRKELGGLPETHLLSPKEKQLYIKDAFVFSWEGYRNFSWGYDENRPVSNRPRNTRYMLIDLLLEYILTNAADLGTVGELPLLMR
jgi:hypothetical protein